MDSPKNGSSQPQGQAAPNLTPSPSSGVTPPVEHRWKKGQSGNPGGMPKGASIVGVLRRDMAKDPDEDGFGKGAREAAKKLRDIASGKVDPDTATAQLKALAILLDRMDGTVIKKSESTVTTVQLQGYFVTFLEIVSGHVAPDVLQAIKEECRDRLKMLVGGGEEG